MNQRREAVASTLMDVAGYNASDDTEMVEVLAVMDAVLAAIDATEPTDAEVEAALRKWRESRIDPLMWEGCGAGAESIECRYRNRMRAALMAARKSRT